jgi:hypothetical protein
VGSERGSLVRSVAYLGVLGQLLLVGFGEALTAKVVIPLLGESLMLSVEVGKLNILAAYDIPAPLLHAYVVVSVVLCEALDYVEWSERMQSERG